MQKGKKNLTNALDQFKADKANNIDQLRGGRPPYPYGKTGYVKHTAEYSKYGGPPVGYDNVVEYD